MAASRERPSAFPNETFKTTALQALIDQVGIEINPWDTAAVPGALAAIDEKLGRLANQDVELASSAALGLRPQTVTAAQWEVMARPDYRNGLPFGFRDEAMTGSMTSHTPATSILTMDDAIVCQFAHSIIILTGDGKRVVADFSSSYAALIHHYDADLARLVADARFVDGDALCFLDDIGPLNYSHWILDWMPRLALVGERVSRPDFHCITSPLIAPFQAASLAFSGISADRIVELQNFQAIRVKRLIVPSDIPRIAHPAHQGAFWALSYIRYRQLAGARLGYRLNGAAKTKPRKVYLSRNDASYRRLLNEDALMSYLGPKGYERVELAKLPYAEQVLLLEDATHVVAPHGAGLTNFLFSGEGCRLLEIFPRTYGTPAYYVIAAKLHRPYATFVADVPTPAAVTVLDDMMVDMQEFDRCCGPLL